MAVGGEQKMFKWVTITVSRDAFIVGLKLHQQKGSVAHSYKYHRFK